MLSLLTRLKSAFFLSLLLFTGGLAPSVQARHTPKLSDTSSTVTSKRQEAAKNRYLRYAIVMGAIGVFLGAVLMLRNHVGNSPQQLLKSKITVLVENRQQELPESKTSVMWGDYVVSDCVKKGRSDSNNKPDTAYLATKPVVWTQARESYDSSFDLTIHVRNKEAKKRAEEVVSALNNQFYKGKNDKKQDIRHRTLPKGQKFCITGVGKGKEPLLDYNKEVENRWGKKTPLKVDNDIIKEIRDEDFVSIAGMQVLAKFENSFLDLEGSFKNKKVNGFGFKTGYEYPEELRKQLHVLEWKNKDNFIVELDTKKDDLGDKFQIILAKGYRREGLQEVLRVCREEDMQKKSYSINKLFVPNIEIEQKFDYQDIFERAMLGDKRLKIKSFFKFKMDKEGAIATAKTLMEIEQKGGWNTKVIDLCFNKEFFILVLPATPYKQPLFVVDINGTDHMDKISEKK